MRFDFDQLVVAAVFAGIVGVSASKARADDGGWIFYSNGAPALDQSSNRTRSPRYPVRRPSLRSPYVLYLAPQTVTTATGGYWVYYPQQPPPPSGFVQGSSYYYSLTPVLDAPR